MRQFGHKDAVDQHHPLPKSTQRSTKDPATWGHYGHFCRVGDKVMVTTPPKKKD